MSKASIRIKSTSSAFTFFPTKPVLKGSANYDLDEQILGRKGFGLTVPRFSSKMRLSDSFIMIDDRKSEVFLVSVAEFWVGGFVGSTSQPILHIETTRHGKTNNSDELIFDERTNEKFFETEMAAVHVHPLYLESFELRICADNFGFLLQRKEEVMISKVFAG